MVFALSLIFDIMTSETKKRILKISTISKNTFMNKNIYLQNSICSIEQRIVCCMRSWIYFFILSYFGGFLSMRYPLQKKFLFWKYCSCKYINFKIILHNIKRKLHNDEQIAYLHQYILRFKKENIFISRQNSSEKMIYHDILYINNNENIFFIKS